MSTPFFVTDFLFISRWLFLWLCQGIFFLLHVVSLAVPRALRLRPARTLR